MQSVQEYQAINIISDIVIKQQPSDFYVDEISYPITTSSGKYYLYDVRKSGYTTNQVTHILAEYLQCHTREICYAGLKDEDGITKQLFSTLHKLQDNHINEFNRMNKHSNVLFIELKFKGQQDEPLKIGSLLGNKFRIIARNIDEALAQKIAAIKNHPSYYINYYGIQRFGLPKRKKNTHHIGKHLLLGEFDKALELVIDQNGYLSQTAASCRDNPKVFFYDIDQRQHAFFLSSYYSYLWNKKIMETIEAQKLRYKTFRFEHIPFHYIKNCKDRLNLLSFLPELHLRKYRVTGNEIYSDDCARNVFIQSEIQVLSVFSDPYHEGKHAAELSFSLPSGVYATVILPQFFYEIS